MKLTPTIENAGYGLSGDIGGLPRTTYYTPDGRVIKAIPDIRSFARRRNGEAIETGSRDANLDRGWLLSPPLVPKLFCPACDRWHDTKAEVRVCKRNQAKFIAGMALKTKNEETDKVAELEGKVAQLTALVEKLMEGKNGGILQPAVNEPKGAVAPKRRTGTAKKGI